jgi:hypothetical protein
MRRLLSIIAAVGLLAITISSVQASSGGNTSVVISGGSPGLVLSGAAPSNFPGVTLNGSDQNVYSTLGTYTAIDQSGSGAGWNITMQATQFTCSAGTGSCPSGGDKFPTGSLQVKPPAVACANSAGCGTVSRLSPPTICHGSSAYALDTGSAVNVASAAANTGMGTFNFTPNSFGTGTGSLQLTVPAYAYATTYTSTLTVTIASGPISGTC